MVSCLRFAFAGTRRFTKYAYKVQKKPERRQSKRVALEVQVEYQKLNAFFADYTKNISKGGTFIKTSHPLPVGTEMVLNLVLPHRTQPLQLRGMVAWSNAKPSADGEEPVGMGIAFVFANEAERHHFEKQVEDLMAATFGELPPKR